jgi:fumarate reductase subunit D
LRCSAHDPEKHVLDPDRGWKPVFGKYHAQKENRMMRASHRQRGFLAAMIHRLSGVALAIFLPIHFLALASALNGAAALDSFLAVTRQPLVACLEVAIVVTLALHMTLGLRVLAIELFDMREKTLAVLSVCVAAVCAVGLLFILNLG